MANENKVVSYFGFAIKSGKIRFGLDSAEEIRGKGVFLLAACRTLSESSLKRAKALAEKFNCPLIITKEKKLSEIIYRENCKFVAITDKELAKAISANFSSEFDLFDGRL